MSNSKQVYKSQGNVSLFDNEETMEILNAMGNPLENIMAPEIWTAVVNKKIVILSYER